MNILHKIIKWWNRPPAADRILDAMSFTEWRRGFDIINGADVFVADFYVFVMKSEESGVIESKWSDAPLKPERGYQRDRVYRKLMSGKRRHVERTDRSADANAMPVYQYG
jgi:hypothetical protein